MHLINVKTLKLEEFVEGSIPPYAILSHRWSDGELTFKEIFKDRPDRNKKGYLKLVKACEAAATYAVDYLWIDTCCIDKRSSAELSEAINSMFAWYESAKVCIVYLEDVAGQCVLDERAPGFQALWREIGQNRWFTRSWTLQELIAPHQVDFYNSTWDFIAEKISKADWIVQITGIDGSLLCKESSPSECSISERMSWAAGRTATRTEDIAYSLMGIFDVNIALLYGEGSKAFRRLQEEIIRRTDDPSFLVWGYRIKEDTSCRLLANSPEDFQKISSGTIRPSSRGGTFVITNIGLSMEIDVVRLSLQTYGLLVGHAGDANFIVVVRKLPSSDNFHRVTTLARRHIHRQYVMCERRRVVVLWDYHLKLSESHDMSYGFTIEARTRFSVSAYTKWIPDLRRSLLSDECSTVGDGIDAVTVDFEDATAIEVIKVACNIAMQSVLVVHLSFDFDSSPWAFLCNEKDESNQLSAIKKMMVAIHRQSHAETDDNMHRIRPTRSKTNLYAFRGPSKHETSMSAKVPTHIVADSRVSDLLLSFIPPHSYQNDSSYWVFRVSEASRRDIPEGGAVGHEFFELPALGKCTEESSTIQVAKVE